MPERRVNVFFYGWFMDPDLLRSKGADPTNIRTAGLQGYALKIGKRAFLVPDSNARTQGVVMELTNCELDGLYADASVSAYRPEPVIIEFADGSNAPALCFNLMLPPVNENRNLSYVAELRKIATRVGLPAEYIHSI